MPAITPTIDNSTPANALRQMITGYWMTNALHVAAKLGLADQLSQGPLQYVELAKRTHTHPPTLFRLLRALASIGVFSDIGNGHFALTPMAALLQTGAPDSMHAFAMMHGEEQYYAWGDLLHSVRTGEPAFEHLFNSPVFAYLRQNPSSGATFHKAMTNMATLFARSVIASYDFAQFRSVVDVGGNQGTLLAAILRAFPNLHGVLFDLPHVIETSGSQLRDLALQHRVTMTGGNFFHEMPAKHDCYVVAQVLHDWNDEHGQMILRRVRDAITLDGKLLVIEDIIREGNEPHFGKWRDLHMLVMAKGCERTAEQYRNLLQASGFELTKLITMGNNASIIEARPL